MKYAFIMHIFCFMLTVTSLHTKKAEPMKDKTIVPKNSYTWQDKELGSWNGYELEYAKYQGSIAPHEHTDTSHLLIVTKGHVVVKLQNRTITLKQGDCFLIPPKTQHAVVAEQEAEVIFLETNKALNLKK